MGRKTEMAGTDAFKSRDEQGKNSCEKSPYCVSRLPFGSLFRRSHKPSRLSVRSKIRARAVGWRANELSPNRFVPSPGHKNSEILMTLIIASQNLDERTGNNGWQLVASSQRTQIRRSQQDFTTSSAAFFLWTKEPSGREHIPYSTDYYRVKSSCKCAGLFQTFTKVSF